MKDQVVEMSAEDTRKRMIALFFMFFVVIFFWMSFHQNGMTMTLFARDYTVPSVDKLTNLWFDLFTLLPILLSVVGLIMIFRKNSKIQTRVIGAVMAIGFALFAFLRYRNFSDVNPFTPQKFQHFNPFFIVALTPIVLAIFSWLRAKGKEPSSPKKIGIGMILTAIGFTILIFASIGLLSPKSLGGTVSDTLVSPYWLISTYLILTIAELFLSPIGISFVSKVSPPKYKGLMQGGWLAAVSLGNLLVGVMAVLWNKVQMPIFWAILVICCIFSASLIFIMLKRLEKASVTARMSAARWCLGALRTLASSPYARYGEMARVPMGCMGGLDVAGESRAELGQPLGRDVCAFRALQGGVEGVCDLAHHEALVCLRRVELQAELRRDLPREACFAQPEARPSSRRRRGLLSGGEGLSDEVCDGLGFARAGWPLDHEVVTTIHRGNRA